MVTYLDEGNGLGQVSNGTRKPGLQLTRLLQCFPVPSWYAMRWEVGVSASLFMPSSY